MKLYLTLLLTFWVFYSFGQLPTTSIHQFKYIETDEGIDLLSPRYLTGFNPEGYNNQPLFLDRDNILISSNASENEFTDIVQLNLRKDYYQYLTLTKGISEYSPTPMPDGKHFSVIRQEGDAQTLWAYPFDGKNAGYPLLDIEDVGYHIWLNEERLALFRVTDTVSFSLAYLENKKVVIKLNDIGRCFKLDQEGNLLFVQKVTSDFWYLKKYNLSDDKITVIAEIDVEDFEVLPSGSFIKASGNLLYRLSAKDDNWKLVADLSDLGLNNITRIAVNGNKLLLVSESN
jgi:hypothetical protein